MPSGTTIQSRTNDGQASAVQDVKPTLQAKAVPPGLYHRSTGPQYGPYGPVWFRLIPAAHMAFKPSATSLLLARAHIPEQSEPSSNPKPREGFQMLRSATATATAKANPEDL